MRILLTNDDGIYAAGIAALKRQMSALGEVVIVAPDAQRSATAHSITIERPLRVREVYVDGAFFGHAVDGSPADCVKIAVREILDAPPDLVLSGINPGTNVGINVLYSGTVAAALEGAILGITSAAVSLAAAERPDFAAASQVTLYLIREILGHNPLPGSLFNINLPNCPADAIKGVAVSRQSVVSYEDKFDVRIDPRGGRYYWMTGQMSRQNVAADSDVARLQSGFVTVTPLHYDLTDEKALEEISRWGLSL